MHDRRFPLPGVKKFGTDHFRYDAYEPFVCYRETRGSFAWRSFPSLSIATSHATMMRRCFRPAEARASARSFVRARTKKEKEKRMKKEKGRRERQRDGERERQRDGERERGRLERGDSNARHEARERERERRTSRQIRELASRARKIESVSG